jgi:hypothetical protein
MGWTCSLDYTKFWVGKVFGEWSRGGLGMWWENVKWVVGKSVVIFRGR